MMLTVRLRHSFPGLSLDVAFAAQAPGVVALFGPSGAGKSTVLAAAAGLLRPALCRIAVDDTVLADTEAGIWLPPERRHIGMVFQDARLFPHMTVAVNLRYGQRRNGGTGPVGFTEIVDLLDLAPLLARRPARLSGGERQRVAIGRALLAQPRLLLMDEPLASLDAARKAEILPYLARLKAALALPVLYVTHSSDELAQLADTVVLLREGHVEAAGPLDEIAARADLPLARRDDAAAVLLGRVVEHDPARGLTRLDCAGVALLVSLLPAAPGSVIRVRVPAREVILARPEAAMALNDALSLHNVVPGTIRAVAADAARGAALIEIQAAGTHLLARITPDAVARLGLVPGGPVLALIKSMSVEVLPGAWQGLPPPAPKSGGAGRMPGRLLR
jgi:molybdate transport system ATP-binding protein